MSPLETLDADALRRVVVTYRDALAEHREAINRLNVYPVPDGDTGTNMALTLASVCEELEGPANDGTMAGTCAAVAHGALMGARGNSGVILCQILRGITAALREHESAPPAALANGLAEAATAAYGAVGKPVEGTILTVARRAGEEAAAAVEADGEASLLSVLEAARAAAAEALEDTPNLLPVLKQAGVVDSGGTGYLLFLDVALHVVDGRPVPEAPEGTGPSAAVDQIDTEALDGPGHGSIADLRYEVMYLLEAPDSTIPGFKDVWAGVGDSIVVVGGDGLWNCHIHTDDIGAAIEAALDAGRPRRIRVTDLLEEAAEERWVTEAMGLPVEADPFDIDEAVTTAVVAVAVGDGVRRLFHNLRVQRIVTGGQTMNPSTADLLAAVEAAPADHVVILPNNKNIVPVAEQVDAMTTKTVRVVPTRGVAEGFAALLAYDPEADVEANLEAMADAAGNVVAGEVTRAVRNSSSDAGTIAEGDWLGISRQGIEVIDADLAGAACRLLDHLIGADHEIVTIIEGEGAGAAVTRRITHHLEDAHPDVEAEVHHGGQPLYPYLFGIE